MSKSTQAHGPAFDGATSFTPSFLADRAAECAETGARHVRGADLATQVTVGYLHGRVGHGLTADALDAAIADAAGATPRRLADAAGYYEHDLTAPLREEPFVRPQRERALLANIPTIAVDPGQRFFTIRYVDHTTNAAKVRDGDTTVPLAGVARTEMAPREIHWTWSGAPSTWLGRRRDAFAGRDNDDQRRRAAVLGIEQVMNQDLLAADAGVQMWGLAAGVNAMPAIREVSPLASLAAATGDQVLTDLDAAAARIAELSDQTMPAPDTLMIDLLGYNLMKRKFNFVAGGPGSLAAALADVLGAHGITQVQIANELRDFGGAGTSGAVFYARGSEMSLRHALGMRPAPVHTYTGPSGEVTVYAGCSGGLVAANGQAVYVRTYTR